MPKVEHEGAAPKPINSFVPLDRHQSLEEVMQGWGGSQGNPPIPLGFQCTSCLFIGPCEHKKGCLPPRGLKERKE